MAADPRGYYKTLGLEPEASVTDVKRAYKKKQVELHPSGAMRKRMRESAEYRAMTEEQRVAKEKELDEQVARVNEAFKVLENENRKKEYDSETGEFARDFFGGDVGANPFADIFRGFYGGGQSETRSKGEDIVAEVTISMSDVFSGVSKKFKISIKKECKDCSGKGGKDVKSCQKCGGRGRVIMQRRAGILITRSEVECPDCRGIGSVFRGPACGSCSGEGVVRTTEIKEVSVRPGVMDGTEIVMSKQGNEKPGGVPGDIIFKVTVRDAPGCKRVGNNLVSNVDVDLLTYLAGGMAYYDHPDGRKMSVQVPPFNKDLRQNCLVVSGAGFPSKRGRGDAYLHLNIKGNVRVDREELSKYIKPEISKPSGEYQSVRARWGAEPVLMEHDEQSDYGGGRSSGGFAEDVLRGFGFF